MHSAWGQAPTAFSYQTFLFLIIPEIYPPNQRVYFSMSQLATVRFAEHIDRFVKGQVIVGEWCALIASGLLQDQFVWLSLEGRGSELRSVGQGRSLTGNAISLWRVKGLLPLCLCEFACWWVSVFSSVCYWAPQHWRSIMRPLLFEFEFHPVLFSFTGIKMFFLLNSQVNSFSSCGNALIVKLNTLNIDFPVWAQRKQKSIGPLLW